MEDDHSLKIPLKVLKYIELKGELPKKIEFSSKGFEIELSYSKILGEEVVCVNEDLQSYENEFESINILTDVLFWLNK